MNENFRVEKFIVGPLATNCYLVYDEFSGRAVLIDPGAYDPAILRSIKDKDIDVACTLNTHGHADHIMGDAGFGFPVLIHELDEPCLRDPQRSLSFLSGADVKPVQVKRLLRDGDTVSVGNIELEIIHTPGHTPGGISVRYEDVLFSGDTLFFEGVGRTNIPGGDHEKLIKSIREKLLVLPDSVKVFPGHGPETTIGHERRNNPFL